MLKPTLSLVALFAASSAFAAPSSSYYTSVDDTSASTMRSTLHDVIDNHTRYPYTSSSTDVWDMINDADEDPNNSGKVLVLYKNASYSKISGGTGAYNREHSWPKSLGFPSSGSIPYTDAHHLFASDTSYNSARGNRYFDDCSSGTAYAVTGSSDDNFQCSYSWEPWDDVKGDLARAMFYMDVRYNGDKSNEPDLVLTDNANLIAQTSGGTAYMGLLSTLIDWHNDDPVSTREEDRNDVVESYQGNRNPFIDHPEWVECIFEGTNCGTSSGGGGGGGGGNTSTYTAINDTGLTGATGTWTYYEVQTGSTATDVDVNIYSGSGDADLYVRKGSQPTSSSYDCRPYAGGNTESCSLSNAANQTYYIGVYAYSGFSGLTLNATCEAGSASDCVDITSGGGGGGGGGTTTTTAVSQSGLSGNSNSWQNFQVTIPSGATNLVVTMSGGSGDGDLYTRYGSSYPTTSTYDCRPYESGNNEECTDANPTSGNLWVSIRGYSAYSGVDLTVTYDN